MPKKSILIEILKSNLLRYQLQSSSSVRIQSFLKSASSSFSKKLRSKINRMTYFFLLHLKNRLFCINKLVTTHFRDSVSMPTNRLYKQVAFYSIPEFALTVFIIQTVYFFIKVRKSLLNFYRVRLQVYFIFWNLLFSVVVAQYSNISLPRNRSLKTVLRSPHIDKRSREQFEKIEHRSLMLLPSYLSNLSYIINYVVPTFGVQITQNMVLKR
jgi:hypothetical protein